jgi:putative SOS response-associated peptidase YedK
MCAAIEYLGRKVYFRDDEPVLPVLLKHGPEMPEGAVRWIAWGRPHGSSTKRSAPLPEGACARLESIKQGKWKRWHATPVLIPAERFMERGPDKAEHWFKLQPGQVIQGCLASSAHNEYASVYIVTVPAPREFAHVHDRWPRVVANSLVRSL